MLRQLLPCLSSSSKKELACPGMQLHQTLQLVVVADLTTRTGFNWRLATKLSCTHYSMCTLIAFYRGNKPYSRVSIYLSVLSGMGIVTRWATTARSGLCTFLATSEDQY